jgi:hypothetical protein
LAPWTLGTTAATKHLFHGQIEGDGRCHQSLTHADLSMNKLQFKGEWHELKGTLNWLTLPRRLVMLNYAFTFLLLP